MTQRKSLTVAGWLLTGLIALTMTFSAVMKLLSPPELLEQAAAMGFPEGLMFTIGVVEAACLVVYLIPRTAVLGAVLLTAYLGGAVVTHVRLSENFASPVIVGVLVWLALYLRDPRVRALLPLRAPANEPHST